MSRLKAKAVLNAAKGRAVSQVQKHAIIVINTCCYLREINCFAWGSGIAEKELTTGRSLF